MNTYLNATQAATLLNLSRQHLYKLTREGVIPAYRPTGKKLYFSEEDLKNWVTKKAK